MEYLRQVFPKVVGALLPNEARKFEVEMIYWHTNLQSATMKMILGHFFTPEFKDWKSMLDLSHWVK